MTVGEVWCGLTAAAAGWMEAVLLAGLGGLDGEEVVRRSPGSWLRGLSRIRSAPFPR